MQLFLSKMSTIKILFVCIGNTCRSPMAECVMNSKIKEHNLNWIVDSAALRHWNVFRRPEERCIQVLGENGLTTEHLGRMIAPNDFFTFDYILGMDDANIDELQTLAAVAAEACNKKMAIIELLGTYIGREEDKIIIDPYFSNDVTAFRHVFIQISESCEKFIVKHNKIAS